MDIRHVTVSGAGLMGTQIAMQAAIHGYEVVCYDISGAQLEKARAFSEEWFVKRVAAGKMTAEAADESQGRLTFSSALQASAERADLIIDAVPDILSIKRNSLAALDQYAPARCIYASNSSYIVSSRFCDAVRDPSKVLNVHFFNPALVMKIVEVVRGPHVSQETFDTAFAFVKSIGKTPVAIEKEIYGFCVNRIFSALTREACYLVDAGVASPEDIDTAVKGALGHAMGPLETLDMTGLDLEYAVYMERFRASGNIADLPAACLTEHYARGEYGRKSGKGFYNYK
ncbi:MAG: 3-hydroxyacyl-CoA dehydrogenase family protein [Oscillospiraceae bacterium]|nr:3-hydroxyacyl-CoA dehydrogenase family protein [Oscillospiraceae bacterium]